MEELFLAMAAVQHTCDLLLLLLLLIFVVVVVVRFVIISVIVEHRCIVF